MKQTSLLQQQAVMPTLSSALFVKKFIDHVLPNVQQFNKQPSSKSKAAPHRQMQASFDSTCGAFHQRLFHQGYPLPVISQELFGSRLLEHTKLSRFNIKQKINSLLDEQPRKVGQSPCNTKDSAPLPFTRVFLLLSVDLSTSRTPEPPPMPRYCSFKTFVFWRSIQASWHGVRGRHFCHNAPPIACRPWTCC